MKNYYKKQQRKISIAIADIWLLSSVCKQARKGRRLQMDKKMKEHEPHNIQTVLWSHFHFKQKFVNCSHWRCVYVCCVLCVCVRHLSPLRFIWFAVSLSFVVLEKRAFSVAYYYLLLLPLLLPSLLFFRYHYIVVIFICSFIFSKLLSNYVWSQNICGVHIA